MQKIVVSRLQNMGDSIMATPILRGLKELYPQAQLIYITRPEGYAPVSRLPYLDEVLVFPDKKTVAAQVAAYKAFKGADLAYLIDTTHRISVLAWLAGAKVRVGMAHKRGKYLTKAVPWIKEMDYIFDATLFAKILKDTTGIDVMKKPAWHKYDFSKANEAEQKHVQELAQERGLDLTKPYIAFSMYTGIRAKNWPEECWQELWARIGQKYKIPVVMTGMNPKKLNLGKNVIDFTGVTTLYEFGYLVQKASLLTSGCSGPIHVARAFGVPTIGLYGPTPPSVGAPPENIATIVSKAKCAPCNGYYSGPCKEPFCMKMISVDEVYAAVDSFLKQKGIN
jgi:heptosyltransferase-2